jgi:hypothetical protein
VAEGSSSIIGCIASSNQNTSGISLPATGAGISPGDNSVVKDCVVESNKGSGIRAGNRCTVTGTRAHHNGIGASGVGISGGTHMLVTGCTATENALDGINVADDSILTGNSANANGVDSAAAGIHTTGGGSRVEGNHVRDNKGLGIFALSTDVIARNTAGGNTGGNFNPSSGANFAPIQTPATATNPLANIVH